MYMYLIYTFRTENSARPFVSIYVPGYPKKNMRHPADMHVVHFLLYIDA